MPRSEVHQCECPHCQQETPHPDQELHRQMNLLLLSRLDEQQRRWYVAVESTRIGAGGDRLLTQITGLDEKTIQRGRQELAISLAERPEQRVRLPGGGRPHAEKKDLALEETLEAMVQPETAGDPMREQKWVRSSLRHLSQHLKEVGHPASPPTVGRLLRKLGYSLRVNVKKHEASAAHPDRQQQFELLERQRQVFQAAGWPIISVDTKKKELIGNYKNAGRAWCQEAEAMNVHDFSHDALMRAVPYGIYDVGSNRGSVYVGNSADTPEFAVTALAHWWEDERRQRFPHATQLLILADAGGSNGCRTRSFKLHLQEQLSDRYRLSVTVRHYPTGCSKWNPIEHRLFSQISLNWAGKPLRTLDTMLNYIRGTTTQTGLTVRAAVLDGTFEKGQKVSDDQMQQLNIEQLSVCSQWNYTIRPRLAVLSEATRTPEEEKVIF